MPNSFIVQRYNGRYTHYGVQIVADLQPVEVDINYIQTEEEAVRMAKDLNRAQEDVKKVLVTSISRDFHVVMVCDSHDGTGREQKTMASYDSAKMYVRNLFVKWGHEDGMIDEMVKSVFQRAHTWQGVGEYWFELNPSGKRGMFT